MKPGWAREGEGFSGGREREKREREGMMMVSGVVIVMKRMLTKIKTALEHRGKEKTTSGDGGKRRSLQLHRVVDGGGSRRR